MKAMIPMNDYGIMADKKNTARVDSRFDVFIGSSVLIRYLNLYKNIYEDYLLPDLLVGNNRSPVIIVCILLEWVLRFYMSSVYVLIKDSEKISAW